jgi:proteasome lid subunit RPN8/RPN11
MNISEKMNSLYEGETERCGFLLKSGELIECDNVHPEPTQGFDFKGEDLVLWTPQAAASWHTHPGADSVLSADDYHAFRSWPDLEHYIVGNDGVTKYYVEKGDVLIAD